MSQPASTWEKTAFKSDKPLKRLAKKAVKKAKHQENTDGFLEKYGMKMP
jgi:hypothetical protein